MSDLLDRDELRSAAEAVLDHPGTHGVELSAGASAIGLTRFANSEIIQNTVRRDVRVDVRVVCGPSVAVAATNQLDPASLKDAVERARIAAKASRPDPEFPGLPKPAVVGRAEGIFRLDESTSKASPGARAAAVRAMLGATEDGNAAGMYETSTHAFAVVSSEGIDCYDGYTRCIARCLVEVDGSSGWGQAFAHSYDDVDGEAAARRALAKARAGRRATASEAGTYEVVLEPSAVAEMLEYLSYAGFGAKQVIEGESFLTRRAGEQVAAPAITVADDAAHQGSVGIGFDFEGVPRRRVVVIDSGTATGPVTDLRTAGLLGTEVTGHYSGSAAFGPYAANPVLEGGDASYEDLIAGVMDGLLVTRFWYVNILDRPAVTLTGMTRDGTFRIRNGEIAEPVRNLRFAQGALEALASARRIGSELVTVAPEGGIFGSVATPALHVGEFHFSSTTTH